MSIQAAVGRIDQILTWQQQVATGQVPGAPATASGAAVQGSTPTQAVGTSAPGSFGDALAAAQGAPSTAATIGATAATVPSGGGAAAVQNMVAMANSLVGKPYVFGGGHSGWSPQSGYDCSGFVSAVLHAGGYLTSPSDTVNLPSQPGIEPGPGQSVTIYDRPQSGENGHVIIELGGQFYESGGMHGSWGGGGGVEKIQRPSDSYLATFGAVLHPAGL
jgi:cell wall-associated NlpC family hydrolase